MKRLLKNQDGFALVETLVIVIVILLIGVAGYIVYKHGHKNGTVSAVNTATNDTNTSKWLSYTSTKGNFTDFFPKTPEVIPQTTETKNGVSAPLNGVISDINNSSYEVIYLTFPNSAKIPNIRDSLSVGYQDIHIISSKNTTIDGDRAETYELTATRKAVKVKNAPAPVPAVKIVDVGEYILVKNVLYQVDATQLNSTHTQAPNAQYFINNFKVLH